ncbi:hypothetical protein, partial [Poseidonocella sp. HB161398]|uniref:hypothetical protein n=1 Tax=Poseidonocella sp. HB161398 TaxID=2320855 RepID=UPI0019802BD3
MSNRLRATSALCLFSLAVSTLSPALAQYAGPALPPLAAQVNDGNWLAEEEARDLLADLFYQRAVHACMTMLPALNVIGMRDGSEAEFGAGYNVLPIW